MFETDLSDKLKRIFGMDRVTFDAPSESEEQDTIFIQIDKSTNRIKDQHQTAKVSGSIVIFSQNNRLHYGFISKQVAEAEVEDTRNFIFHEFEENSSSYRNLVTRSASFVFFFSSQYNPEQGQLTQVTTTVEITE